MVRIWYDPGNDMASMTDTGDLSAEEMVRAGAMIVNCMVRTVRSRHGNAAAEAMLMLIRNMDEAGAFGLDVIGRCE